MRIPEVSDNTVATRHQIGYTPPMSVILDRLRAEIRASDLTPSAIAKNAGIARSQVSRLLREERGLSIEGVERLADYLGLRITIAPKATKKGR
jgi:transcriptional regulator with XRE-family HTH domain